MKITDEMVEKAFDTINPMDVDVRASWDVVRDAIEAVAPLIRSAALEEAARVADEDWNGGFPESDLGEAVLATGDRIAAAIRALKDKPHE